MNRQAMRLLLPRVAVLAVTGCAAAAPGDAAATGFAAGSVAAAPSTHGPGAAGSSADTAGLGARIATAFPGWRLSTEAEIGDRFPLTDGSAPEQLWEAWGSGRVWWVWPGDYDGDGQGDRLAILSNAADPSEDKLVVLHGDGTAADLGSPGGWGIRITPKGEQLRGVTLRSDAIATIFWEKGADVVVWNPATGTYEHLESDCC